MSSDLSNSRAGDRRDVESVLLLRDIRRSQSMLSIEREGLINNAK